MKCENCENCEWDLDNRPLGCNANNPYFDEDTDGMEHFCGGFEYFDWDDH